MLKKVAKKIVFSSLSQDRIVRFSNILNRYKSNRRHALKASAPNPQAELLFKDGIIVIENFLSAEKCEYYKKRILDFSSQYSQSINLPNGTKIMYRSGDHGGDAGMIDIKHIDRSIPELSAIIEEGEQFIPSMNYAARTDFAFISLNAYVNSGIKHTRDFHIDDISPITYKAFIYLTDVDDESYGPYTFIKGSQRFNPQIYISLFRNVFNSKSEWGEIAYYNKHKMWKVLGKKGTLILSDQSGIHRGLPQQEGKVRVALVLNYIEKDYLTIVSQKD
ncbi:MAG TPA: phytanoyl-CoA dioxygenase family protein [Pyrinomonadaceae bacterium]|nr:phytanoyl-CoA dioxygenase family protein [Pyrinomonadaceae bacterium]